jgi:hypothetical protein
MPAVFFVVRATVSDPAKRQALTSGITASTCLMR